MSKYGDYFHNCNYHIALKNFGGFPPVIVKHVFYRLKHELHINTIYSYIGNGIRIDIPVNGIKYMYNYIYTCIDNI